MFYRVYMLRVKRKHFIQEPKEPKEPKELKGANSHNETLLVNTILNGNVTALTPAFRKTKTSEVKKKKIKYIDTSPLLRGNHI